MKADLPADTKTRERTAGAATAVQVKHGDSGTAKRVQAGPTCSTSFGVKAEPPAILYRDDVLVENGTAAPKSCTSPLKMRTPTAIGSLLPTDKTSTATKTTFHQLPLWFYPTKGIKLRTYASYYSSFGWINNQQVHFCPRVIETKSGQNLVFDPDGSVGRLRASPFLGTWRALFCGEVLVVERLVAMWSVFLHK